MSLDDALVHGSMPLAVTGEDPVGYLLAYAETYLQEEIRAEALTRSIGSFSRFLEVAARQNGQVTNLSAIARDAAVGRSTVQNYFEILEETLVGHWVHPWKLKRATKQVAHPKFYLFDCGVARALSGRLPYPPAPEEEGPLLETLLYGEIRAYIAYAKLRYPLYYWRNYDRVEVDLLCETRNGFIAVEMKSAVRWERRYNRGLERMRTEFGAERVRCYGVYRGARPARWNDIEILPVMDFLRRLWDGTSSTDRIHARITGDCSVAAGQDVPSLARVAPITTPPGRRCGARSEPPEVIGAIGRDDVSAGLATPTVTSTGRSFRPGARCVDAENLRSRARTGVHGRLRPRRMIRRLGIAT